MRHNVVVHLYVFFCKTLDIDVFVGKMAVVKARNKRYGH